MSCIYCNVINGEEAKCCRNCKEAPNCTEKTGLCPSTPIRKYLLIFFWVGYAITLSWLIVLRIVIPLFYKKAGVVEWNKIAFVYTDFTWPADLTIVFVLAIICTTTKDKDYRKMMLILSALILCLIVLGWIL